MKRSVFLTILISAAILHADEPTLVNGNGDGVNPAPFKAALNLVKGDVGLGNADNTSDASKPVSAATQTALDGKSNTGHAHVISDTTGLQTALDNLLISQTSQTVGFAPASYQVLAAGRRKIAIINCQTHCAK